MKFRILLISAALVSASLCYIYGFLHQSNDAIYTGLRSMNASDFSQHLSWIDQSRRGHFFLQNKFTSDPQGGDLVRPVYFLLSQPFRLTTLPNNAVFHILRVLCGAVLLAFLFPMLRQYDADHGVIRRAFLLLVFTSGLGFLTKQWIQSADMDIPESILFVSLGEAPHFLYSLLFLWGGITAFFAGAPAIYFVCLLILWWEHPFEAVILIVVCVANLWILKGLRTRLIVLFVTAGISIAPYLYYHHLQTLPAFSGWGSAQNRMSSPAFTSYISAFLPLLILAFIGARTLWKEQERKRTLFFLGIWIIAQFAMVYLPFTFQRRLIAGVQFPLALLAAYGLRPVRKQTILTLLILILSLSNISLMTKFISELKTRSMPYYLSASYNQAFEWLWKLPEKDGVILSGFVTGNLIPGFTGFTSYLGHSSLTPNVVKKKSEIAAFYQDPSLSFLLKNRVRYIFWGLEERRLSSLDLSTRFGSAFENEQVAILDPRIKIENMNIVVGGHSRNIGKTSVVAGIIHGTQEWEWTSMKITQFGHGICSRNGRACHCSTEEHRYAILEEKNPAGKGDTCRFLAAGAKKSIWVRTKQGMLFEAMPAIQQILNDRKNTIIESNSILEFLEPDLYLVVLDYSVRDFKLSSKKFLDRADACILVNSTGRSPEWEGIAISSFLHKPVFEINPPPYISQEILSFVRAGGSGMNPSEITSDS